MIKAFQQNKDIYATIASLSFNLPYENCLEFHPETGEYQKEGKMRRDEAKKIVLGITYGRSIPSIAEQLFGGNANMSEKEKISKAQNIYDAVLNAFPGLRRAMIQAQKDAQTFGYVETILGRRRHLPDMQLPEFEFKPAKGYINPDFDPLDPSGGGADDEIPERIKKQLLDELSKYKYFGQIAKRMRQLYDEDDIKVINNRRKISDASRQTLNSKVQGSAADQTKLAILRLHANLEWHRLGGRLLVPVHDELIAEIPIQNYERGEELLSSMMIEAADFLPFPTKCDVTTSIRWYGLEYPCKYPQPKSLDNISEDEIKWLQYHLIELEYILPIYKEPDGSTPRGDAGKGINGIWSDDLQNAIDDYKKYYNLTDKNFIEVISKHVVEGRIEERNNEFYMQQ